ncbi:MAG: PQQ-binding-like beta-propeller repeat protein [Phycisphaerales bacterium]|nr:MAG: PQQ-binding-like beta-propeller repeat protein [Phycisphaerales bacterium]
MLKRKKRFATTVALVLSVLGTGSMALAQSLTTPGRQAEEILKTCNVAGGLIVHIGCGNGRLTAALRAGDSFLVHGLDRSKTRVGLARKYIQAFGNYGPVSVDQLWGDHLPYTDNLVNLVVSDDLSGVSINEVMRVLAPGGSAYIKTGGEWERAVKPRPDQIDDWTHALYDATNNAVSNDSIVGPPHQIQWVVGPQWARSHDHLASLSTAVSAGGRIFYIVDEAPIALVILEPDWHLVARDAFNGVLLWKRRIPKWQWHLRAFRTGPSDLSRRLVAVGDRVYVTLGIDAALVALDAATGETVRTYDQTEGTLEVVYSEGRLFIVAGQVTEQKEATEGLRPGFAHVRPQRPGYAENPPAKRIVVLDAETGEVLWNKSDSETVELMPTTLAVSKGKVFFQNADEVFCMDAKSGEHLWRAKRMTSRSRPTWSAPTLVVYGDVVLTADRAVADKKTLDTNGKRKVEWIVSARGGQAPVGELIAFSAENGDRLWSCAARECYNAPADVLIADGLVWTGSLVRASDPGIIEGRDPATGEVRRTRPADKEFFVAGMGHHRCYRNKGTSEYLVLGRSGVEFVELDTGEAIPNHWVRGACQYGVIPANGLLYAPTNPCACFITAKLAGFNCLAPRPRSPVRAGGKPQSRLEKGPAYTSLRTQNSELTAHDDWPTYRHDNARSGYTSSLIGPKLKQKWKKPLGGRLSSLVVARGKLFVVQIDAHTVHALSAESGRKIWSYTAGGRIDSPPTIWKGLALFGCSDGWVYCLRALDGTLVWRFRAAPDDRRIVAYGQLESAWPVPGSVLAHDGTAYCSAGRSSYLDGSIRLLRLNAKTGELLSETIIDHRDPETGYQRKGSVSGTNIPGALPDVLSCDGRSIFMRHNRFDLEGRPQEPDVPHLFSSAGFVEDSWWHRTYWQFGTAMGTNYGGWPQSGNRVPAGRILAFDDDYIYGFGRSQYIHHGAHVGIDGATVFHFRPKQDAQRRFTHYRAFAVERQRAVRNQPADAGAKRKRSAVSRGGKKYRWTGQQPVIARAIVLTRNSLFLAGPRDVFSSAEPAATLEGRRGGLLLVLSTADGSELARHELESPPVFDGMAASRGRLYMAATNGEVLCLE